MTRSEYAANTALSNTVDAEMYDRAGYKRGYREAWDACRKASDAMRVVHVILALCAGVLVGLTVAWGIA